MEIAVIFLNLLSFLYAMKNIMYIFAHRKKRNKLWIGTLEEAHKVEKWETEIKGREQGGFCSSYKR